MIAVAGGVHCRNGVALMTMNDPILGHRDPNTGDRIFYGNSAASETELSESGETTPDVEIFGWRGQCMCDTTVWVVCCPCHQAEGASTSSGPDHFGAPLS